MVEDELTEAMMSAIEALDREISSLKRIALGYRFAMVILTIPFFVFSIIYSYHIITGIFSENITNLDSTLGIWYYLLFILGYLATMTVGMCKITSVNKQLRYLWKLRHNTYIKRNPEDKKNRI